VRHVRLLYVKKNLFKSSFLFLLVFVLILQAAGDGQMEDLDEKQQAAEGDNQQGDFVFQRPGSAAAIGGYYSR